MAKSMCKSAKRLLKCFCGCSDLTEEEVKLISRLNGSETLTNHQANKLLHKFLEQSRDGDKSECEQYLDVYEQCRTFMLEEARLLTLDELDELTELGLPYHLEKDLKKQIQTGEISNITRCLSRIQGECRNEIEGSQDYKAFKQAILNKLKQL